MVKWFRSRWEAWMGFLYITYAMPIYAKDEAEDTYTARKLKATRAAKRVETYRRMRVVGELFFVSVWVSLLIAAIKVQHWLVYWYHAVVYVHHVRV
ncbi:MAG: hypothetical protein JWO15_3538 [Sphingomonadales bacterium]|nr:hypothetical protein [Sphingomonadales bacterium]